MMITPMYSNGSLRSLERSASVSSPSRAISSTVSSNSEPRGTALVRWSTAVMSASFSAPAGEQPSGSALLAGERDVQAVHIERDADCGEPAAEAREHIVVASTSADRGTERGVVDLEHGAGVAAEVAHEAQIEDHALGDRRV